MNNKKIDDTTWKFVANSSSNPSCFTANIMSFLVMSLVPDSSNGQHHFSFAMASFARFDGALGVQIVLLEMSKIEIENES